MTSAGRDPRAARADRAVIARGSDRAARDAMGVPSDRARRSSAAVSDRAICFLDDVLDAFAGSMDDFGRARGLRRRADRDAGCQDAGDGRTDEQVSKHVPSLL